ncbi:protein phosphatase CheZ [Hydrogenophaga sp.]|uniref:protein phosphatase CheZ n=1 Tax=Hydrogenophaga sp. TaxID=1904254 RepID=UPI003565F14C
MHETPPGDPRTDDVFNRLGSITRQLHDALDELGHTPKLKGSVQDMPDVRSRLDFIAYLTGDAAERVLNQVDELKRKQALIADRAKKLDDALNQMPAVAAQNPHLREWVHDIGHTSAECDERLTDVMLAQDFHDLTGQVIQRVVEIAANIEKQLLELLLHAAPLEGMAGDGPPTLAGPVFQPQGRNDVVTNQDQVDSLLAKLGF